jgi:serine/threonine protein kinase
MTKLFEDETTFSESNRIIVIDQILRALNYMHQNNLVHRDLKTDNVVYAPSADSDDFDNLELKLIDFGFANINLKNELSDFVGTPYYLAPEIINREKYGGSVDIWALGVLTYFIIDGDYPFLGNSRQQLFQNIIDGRFSFNKRIWNSVSGQCKDFITKCLTVSQGKRQTAAQLLDHPWIKIRQGGKEVSLSL